MKKKDLKSEHYYWAYLKKGKRRDPYPLEPEVVYLRDIKYDFDLTRIHVSRFDYFYADGYNYPNHINDYDFIKKIAVPRGAVSDLVRYQKDYLKRYDEVPEKESKKPKVDFIPRKDIKESVLYWAIQKPRPQFDYIYAPEIVHVFDGSLPRLCVSRSDCMYDQDGTSPNWVGDWKFIQKVAIPPAVKKRYEEIAEVEKAEEISFWKEIKSSEDAVQNAESNKE